MKIHLGVLSHKRQLLLILALVSFISGDASSALERGIRTPSLSGERLEIIGAKE